MKRRQVGPGARGRGGGGGREGTLRPTMFSMPARWCMIATSRRTSSTSAGVLRSGGGGGGSGGRQLRAARWGAARGVGCCMAWRRQVAHFIFCLLMDLQASFSPVFLSVHS